MNGKKVPILSIVLYVLAGLLGAFTLWSAYYYYDNISTLVRQGQAVIKGNEFELASYLMANIAQYAFYAVVLGTLGRIVHINSPDTEAYLVVEDYEDELEEEGLEGLEEQEEQEPEK